MTAQLEVVVHRLTWWVETESHPGSFSPTAADVESLNSWGLAVYSSAGLKTTASSPEPWWSAPGPPASPGQGLRRGMSEEQKHTRLPKYHEAMGHVWLAEMLPSLVTVSDPPALVFSEPWIMAVTEPLFSHSDTHSADRCHEYLKDTLDG